jgi:hypothetical protein
LTRYLDASVIVPAFIDEPPWLRVRRLFGSLDGPPMLSDFAAGEFASAVVRRFRMALQTATEVRNILIDFDGWTAATVRLLPILSADIATGNALVRQLDLKLRLPDAIHLAACQRRGLTLATLDDMLAQAAGALGVAHIIPD